MPRLRTNHTRDKRPFLGLAIRVALMFGLIILLFFILWQYLERNDGIQTIVKEDNIFSTNVFVPEGNTYEIVTHTYYTLGYSEPAEQAAWVSYLLRKEDLLAENVPRQDRFEIDPLVTTESAEYFDYSGSGFSRGHLAPAADMAFNEEAMTSSFLMSNMSPQRRAFNGGIWRELEELTRDWAFKNKELYIVTGPILTDIEKYIGKKNKVAVPRYYYKALLDADSPELKSIAFIIPNESSDLPIMDYAITVDSLEEILHLDLFSNIFDPSELQNIESTFSSTSWPTNDKKYQLRVNQWNKN
jgi:endonuclease G